MCVPDVGLALHCERHDDVGLALAVDILRERLVAKAPARARLGLRRDPRPVRRRWRTHRATWFKKLSEGLQSW
ncbi:hypothetical protein GCM10010425_59880 [Streptomyces spororaveus]|uniref:Uncharacterized protein n=1 Tax=Streptomyces spororaveus TaxID=284039 RepID=A0ABQ3T6X4_9ACTN|nr:hypothetical protein Sspor_17020 [Streptomyces spororaveus]